MNLDAIARIVRINKWIRERKEIPEIIRLELVEALLKVLDELVDP